MTRECYQTSVQQPQYYSSAKKEFRAKKLKLQEKVYLESHRGRKDEPAGLHGLRK